MPVGTHNGRHKVNEDQVVQMRLERAAGDTIPELAERYRLSTAMVSFIVTGKNWTHAGGPLSPPGVGAKGRRIIAHNRWRNRERTD